MLDREEGVSEVVGLVLATTAFIAAFGLILLATYGGVDPSTSETEFDPSFLFQPYVVANGTAPLWDVDDVNLIRFGLLEPDGSLNLTILNSLADASARELILGNFAMEACFPNGDPCVLNEALGPTPTTRTFLTNEASPRIIEIRVSS